MGFPKYRFIMKTLSLNSILAGDTVKRGGAWGVVKEITPDGLYVIDWFAGTQYSVIKKHENPLLDFSLSDESAGEIIARAAMNYEAKRKKSQENYRRRKASS